MPFESTFFVVAYDIASNSRRRQAEACAREFGVRLQRSLFVCQITDAEANTLSDRVIRLIDHEQDRVAVYRLCAKDAARVVIQGGSRLQESELLVT